MPLNEICEQDIDTARKLRDALAPWLRIQNDAALPSQALEAGGVADYSRVFGHKISGRYWRELFSRTLHRDNGAEDWSRLEIYLPDRLSAKEREQEVDPEKLEPFARIADYIAACGNPTNPSETEKLAVWTMALDQYRCIAAKENEARAARLVRCFLFQKAAFLAPSRDALLKAFNRRLERFESANGDASILKDGRADNGDKYTLTEDDRDLLIHRSVFYYRGDIAPAWRDLIRSGFSSAVRECYAQPTRKSYVPASIMESVEPEVKILTVMHQGPCAFDSIKGYVMRNYDGIHSLDCMVADDFTMPVYYYVPDGNGWFNLTRGQILIFQDFRTLRVLGWSIQPDRNYNSLVIRSLCTHVFSEHGVPSVLQFENGIWRSATLLKGKNPGPMNFTEVVQGLHEFGIKFIHSIRPGQRALSTSAECFKI